MERMFPKSKYTHSVTSNDSLSLSALDVAVRPKRKIESSTSNNQADYSSSLDDGPRAKTTSRSVRSTTIEAIIEMYGERPLPPTPRIPSSIYISSKRNSAVPNSSPISRESLTTAAPPPSGGSPSPNIPGRRTYFNAKGVPSAKHLSQLYKRDIGKKLSPPDASSEQRKFFQEAQPKGAPEVGAMPTKPVPFTEWKAPAYREPSNSSKSSLQTCLSRRSSSVSSTNMSPATLTADEQAARYLATIYQRNSTNPAKGTHSLTLGPNLAIAPVRLAATKDASRQASVPYPLLTSIPDKTPPGSRFSPSSPSSSEMDSLLGVASSFRTRAKKVFLQPKRPKRPTLKRRLGFKHSDIVHASKRAESPHSRKAAERTVQKGMGEGLLEICDIVQKYPPAEPTSMPRQVTGSLQADQLSKAAQKLPAKEMCDVTVSLAEYQYYGRKAWREPKEGPYVYREPRMRLPNPQPGITPTTTAPATITKTKSPDTTYKIEMPAPPTPSRLTATLLFDYIYDTEIPLPTTPNRTRSSSLVLSMRTSAGGNSQRLSHSSPAPSLYGKRSPDRLSRAEKQRTERYSLPLVATHTRQNSNNDDDNFSSSKANRPSEKERKLLSESSANPVPAPPELTAGRRRRKIESATLPFVAVDLGKGRRKGVGEMDKDRTSRTRQMSSERRREELKKRIKVMGDASAVGVPF